MDLIRNAKEDIKAFENELLSDDGWESYCWAQSVADLTCNQEWYHSALGAFEGGDITINEDMTPE